MVAFIKFILSVFVATLAFVCVSVSGIALTLLVFVASQLLG